MLLNDVELITHARAPGLQITVLKAYPVNISLCSAAIHAALVIGRDDDFRQFLGQVRSHAGAPPEPYRGAPARCSSHGWQRWYISATSNPACLKPRIRGARHGSRPRVHWSTTLPVRRTCVASYRGPLGAEVPR